MEKRGLSETVSTLLIVLISVAAVVLVTTIILSLVNETSLFNTSNTVLECLDLKLHPTFCGLENGYIKVSVERGGDAANLSGLTFLFYKENGEIILNRTASALGPLMISNFDFLESDFPGVKKFNIAGVLENGELCSPSSEPILCARSTPEDSREPLLIVTDSLPQGTAGVFYDFSLTANGGTGLYNWSWNMDDSTGLSLSSRGRIYGTPIERGPYDIIITLDDGQNQISKNFELIINQNLMDFDGDGIYDSEDNCPYNPNSNQTDSNLDNVGNVCSRPQGDCGGEVECFCGDRMVNNFTMITALRNRTGGSVCLDSGLIIGRDFNDPEVSLVHLNCAGNEIGGIGTGGKGIRVSNTHLVQEIENCRVHDFDQGIYYGGGSDAFIIKNSELFNNLGGIETVAGEGVFVVDTTIHDNSKAGIGTDETLRFTVTNSIISNNGVGISFSCQTPWTADLNSVLADMHNITGNVIENNSGVGIILYTCGYSTIDGNTIRNNDEGIHMTLERQFYRVWVNGLPVTIGFGRDRTNYNSIKNNVIYNNVGQDLHLEWKLSAQGIDYGSPYYEPYINFFENNSLSGKDILYFYDLNNTKFENINTGTFVCFGCKNVSISNSNISQTYFAYSLDDDPENDVTNVLSEGAYYTVYKIYSNGIGFDNIQVKNNRHEIIHEEYSRDNQFSNLLSLDGDCSDQDKDGYGVCPRCGLVHGCVFNQSDCNDVNGLVHLGAREILNGMDDNCNGLTDLEDPNLFLHSCFGDLNHNGYVGDFGDGGFLGMQEGSTGCGYYGNSQTDWCGFADINRDGVVDQMDLNIFRFMQSYSPGSCNCAIGPELCDQYDNDCDSAIDEGCNQP